MGTNTQNQHNQPTTHTRTPHARAQKANKRNHERPGAQPLPRHDARGDESQRTRPAPAARRPATRDRRPLPPQQYNFRHYAVRRVREDFRKNASLTGAEATDAIKRGHVDLQVLRRQQIVGNLYPAAMSVMDAPAAKR